MNYQNGENLSSESLQGKSNSSVCVFSLGQYGYDVAFGRAVNTQKTYCDKNGYDYVCINQDGSELLGRENIWLKAFSFLGALKNYDYVLYLDTDVEIKETAPPFLDILSDDRPVGLVAGHSGRVNAGVIYAKRTQFSLTFFSEWVSSLGKPISVRHDVGWGENGHLIRLAEKYCIPLLDTIWNNTFDPNLDDYVRHYTGPLRREYEFIGDEAIAWSKIQKALEVSKRSADVDILRSFSELKKVYEKNLQTDIFASFNSIWEQVRSHVFSGLETCSVYSDDKTFHSVYIVENIEEDSPNAYVVSLRDGLEKVIGANRVYAGVNFFWEHNFTSKDVVQIEWIESLFNWNVPSDDEIARFQMRLAEIAAVCPVLYTAHNYDLMPTYGDKRLILMESLAEHCTLICHLSEANSQAYIAHHKNNVDLSHIPTSVVPHGDYQPYFRKDLTSFEDESLNSNKIKVLVFGHIRSKSELDFCLEVAENLTGESYEMIFTGVIHPDLLHWKEIHQHKDHWSDGPRRIHFKVVDEKIIDLISQVDCMLIPRFDRLNSGVQYLAHTMLKPCFVPAESSMIEVQSKVTGYGCYPQGNAEVASKVIEKYFSNDPSINIKNLYKSFLYNYREQDTYAVGEARLSAYEKAVSFFQQSKIQEVNGDN